MTYTISREIGIDAGHRVPTHGSKCKNLHGHRYRIQAVCESEHLHGSGTQKDMTLDFGFLKEEMMCVIDANCDHGLILWAGDRLVPTLFTPQYPRERSVCIENAKAGKGFLVASHLLLSGVGKLYLIPEIPTAEVLAKHWFGRLAPRVSERSNGLAELVRVKVWETPNCWASYEKSFPIPDSLLKEAEEKARLVTASDEEGGTGGVV